MQQTTPGNRRLAWLLLAAAVLFAGCAGAAGTPAAVSLDQAALAETAVLSLPPLSPAPLNGGRLRVIATTSLIGDVVARVGGDAIDLTVLIGAGQDPHSFEPAARDLTAVSDAQLIFVNGWNLEEGLIDNLAAIGTNALLVPISAGIEPLPFDGSDAHDDEADEAGHDDGAADPHVWFDVRNVAQWTDNAAVVLSGLDPANAAAYAQNAAAYQMELEELERYAADRLSSIPAARRLLVTNHDSFAYFAAAFDFEVLGTVIPGASTLAEPAASDLSSLIDAMEARGVCTLFTETTVSESLARTVAAELQSCRDVRVVALYTGAVGPAGSGADSYVGMFRANVDAIVQGLQ